jgi:hypothetical protein
MALLRGKFTIEVISRPQGRDIYIANRAKDKNQGQPPAASQP